MAHSATPSRRTPPHDAALREGAAASLVRIADDLVDFHDRVVLGHVASSAEILDLAERVRAEGTSMSPPLLVRSVDERFAPTEPTADSTDRRRNTQDALRRLAGQLGTTEQLLTDYADQRAAATRPTTNS